MNDYEDIKREAELRRELGKQQAEADFIAVATTPEGRRFIKRLLSECHVYQTTFAGENTLTTAFKEGKRAVGLSMLVQFEACPDLYVQFLAEKDIED